MRLIAAALLAALIASVHAGEEAPQQILPVDEAVSDATWQRFKKRLIGAVEKRDRKFLLSILDPNVRNQMENTRGVAEFRKQWDLEASDSPLWRELRSALQLGAAFVKRDKGSELCAPYLLAKWPGEYEPFDYAAIIARESVVRAEPSSASAALDTLSYHVVRVFDWEVADKSPDTQQKWVHIRAGDRDGYVPEEHVRSPVEHVACFAKTPAGWRMTAFAPAGGE